MKRLSVFVVCISLVLSGLLAQGTKEPVSAPDEVYTITYYHNSSSARIDESKDEILKHLNEKLGIDLKINIITSDFESKLNLEVSSGNAPDMMQVSPSQFKSLEEQGILLPLEDILPTMKNFMKRYPNVLNDPTLRYKGHLYFLKGRDSADQTIKAYSSLWVRKDWLDKLGLEVPKTLEDFKNVAIAFATKDPDGNGKNDTFGFTGQGGNVRNKDMMYAWNPILGAFGVGELNWIIQDGKLVYSPVSPAYQDALKWINDFIKTGAVDPDIMLMNTYDQIREKVYRNQIGMMYMTWAEFVKAPYDKILAEMTPDAQWIQINPPVGPNGDSYDSCYSIPGYLQQGRVLSADLADNPKKLAKVLEYLDYIVYGEGLNIVCYGLPGIHWNYDANGNVVTTDRISEVSYSWQHQNMARMEKDYMAIKFPLISKEIAFAANLPRIDAYNNFVEIPAARNQSDLIRYVDEETVRFMYGRRPLSEFNDFVSTLYKTYGLAEYETIATENLKEAGIL